MGKTLVLNGEVIREAVCRRIPEGRSFSDRDVYIVIYWFVCRARRVVSDKLTPVPEVENYLVGVVWSVGDAFELLALHLAALRQGLKGVGCAALV